MSFDEFVASCPSDLQVEARAVWNALEAVELSETPDATGVEVSDEDLFFAVTGSKQDAAAYWQ